MATALVNPNGGQIIATLAVGGAASEFGRWTAEDIDYMIANSLINIVQIEYDYAVELLTDAGKDDQLLSDEDYAAATKGMIYAIGYQLLEADLASTESMPAEPNNGIHREEYNKRKNNFFGKAGLAWKSIGITSKYYVDAFKGNPPTRFVDTRPNYGLDCYGNNYYNG